MKKVAFYTLGCRVNTYETEAIAETFIKHDYELVEFDEFADVYVVNTCTVTNIGDKKSRQMLRRAKRINPESCVVAVGCYVQVAPEEVEKLEDVDIIIGTKDKGKIIELVEEFERNKRKIKHVENVMSIRQFEELEIDEYQDKTRAFLKIQDGCDRFCSYCLIPFARGPVRSRKPENILKEVEKLASNGYKEIILSGIHVASYGKDLKDIDLVDVIEMIQKVDGIERIRIGSVDPTFFSEDKINRLKNIEKFCPHFHLSLQSGCDETLKRMNRHYTTEEYKIVVENLRKTFEDVSITTDIIVGFPGETDDEFAKTYEFLSKINLSKMHIFKYSPRRGTKAAEMKEQVKESIKENRSHKLIELDKKLEEEFINKFIGKTMDVLFEEYNDGYYWGYTKNYIRVGTSFNKDLSGQIFNVKILESRENKAIGRVEMEVK
ncbi:Threonylcarbamoyladenosine tRNA methylthiotransferase MtaB [Caloramator mitchellensis]|uniref:Threonylcarbamoyladenosine tRNA methylthiotransferase MtaB n=1 Tax=Caloramator mitchellensis TaxID=908809 RepID=A0A0R3JT14_CALMK|nr:tRNA (N(6)-L-threonylcarbamoyladenosine(37)-C(2))-methylthiotransferase MtaB [Caloramator mitchellensis]KRQ86657.1 Threonylcarbamoyladenosine tRNA methylthiotransferase MtaB [Caloramator mitchellensis]